MEFLDSLGTAGSELPDGVAADISTLSFLPARHRALMQQAQQRAREAAQVRGQQERELAAVGAIAAAAAEAAVAAQRQQEQAVEVDRLKQDEVPRQAEQQPEGQQHGQQQERQQEQQQQQQQQGEAMQVDSTQGTETCAGQQHLGQAPPSQQPAAVAAVAAAVDTPQVRAARLGVPEQVLQELQQPGMPLPAVQALPATAKPAALLGPQVKEVQLAAVVLEQEAQQPSAAEPAVSAPVAPAASDGAAAPSVGSKRPLDGEPASSSQATGGQQAPKRQLLVPGIPLAKACSRPSSALAPDTPVGPPR
jgi:hypothetical protein